MLRQEQNDLLTQTGPGTPMGRLFRSYWLPALLPEELPRERLPARPGKAPVGAADRIPRHGRTAGTHRRVLRSPRHFALVRPQRGMRAALSVSRLEVRRDRAVHGHAVGTRGFGFREEGQAEVVSARRARRRAVDLHGSARQAAAAARVGVRHRAGGASRSCRSGSRNATGCRRWKAVSTRVTSRFCIAAT